MTVLRTGLIKCEACGDEFHADPTFDAQAEKDRDYPDIADEDCAIICDDCYQIYNAMMAPKGHA